MAESRLADGATATPATYATANQKAARMKAIIAWAAAIAAFLLVGLAITFAGDSIGLDVSAWSFNLAAANLSFQVGYWAGLATYNHSLSAGFSRKDVLFCGVLVSATVALLVLLGITQMALRNVHGGTAEVVRQSADLSIFVAVAWYARNVYKRSAAAMRADSGD